MSLRAHTVIARGLRRTATDAEQLLWRAFRGGALPWKFRRQHPIGRRVVDFACPARKVAIELDGGQHLARQEEDAARSAELALRGWRVIRFWNNDVIGNLEGVLEVVRREMERSPPPHPAHSAPRGGEGK
ncbi:MAG TPA: DUF559 domain-containing protein [Acetobacteraceae bacterium]|nr:DUF559 domain-containing protein [Acetobacteraceae bacterium]